MAGTKPVALKHALTDEQLEFFWTNGYISLPGLFDASEVDQMQQAADELYNSKRVDPFNTRYDFTKVQKPEDANANTKFVAQPGDADSADAKVWRIDPFFDLHEVMRSTVFDRKILDALASIYQGREPRLFKDKLIYKPPHTHGSGLHQDYNWWQGYPTSLISVCVAIDHANEDNGCTQVYPYDMQQGFIGEAGSFSNDKALAAHPAAQPECAVKNIAKPGDVLMFHCFTPHSAGANNTEKFRRQMFLTYNDSADGEFYFSHGEHYRSYFLASRDQPEKYSFR